MKNPLFFLALLLFTVGCKNAKDNRQEQFEELNSASVDTILTEFEEQEQIEHNDDQEESEHFSIHDIYIPKIDSVITLFNSLDESIGWTETKNFQNLAIAESTEGNELLFYKAPNYVKYRLNTFGEMGKMEETFYLIKNELILYSHTEIRYNAPITLDSTELQEDMQVFDPAKSELLIEDSYFKNGKIIYQACQDCGGTGAKEYLKSIEEDVKAKLTAFKKLAK